MSLEKIPKYSTLIKEPGMQVPVLVHTKIPGLPNKKTLNAEKEIAKDKRLFHHVAALSDVNKKKKIIHPASSIAASENYLIPQLLDSAPNCGMRIIKTDLTEEEVSGKKLNELFNSLLVSVPARKYVGSNIPKSVIIDSFINGSEAIARHVGARTLDEIENTYEQGNMFKAVPDKYRIKNANDLMDVIPSRLVNMARFRLGILGATKSHFLSLMKIDSIIDSKLAESAGLKKGQYVFYMHTGSGILGRYIGYLYSAQPKNLNQSLQFGLFTKGFGSDTYKDIRKQLKKAAKEGVAVSYEDGSPEITMAIKAWQAGANQGFANRTLITHNIDLTLEKLYKRQVSMELVYDAPHELVSYEKHYGKNVWVHRNGTTRALSSTDFSKHHRYSKTGEPALIAPFEQTYGFIGFARSENKTTFKSANHELGKLLNTPKLTFDSIKTTRANKLSPVKIYTQKKTWKAQPKSLHADFSEAIAKEIEANKLLRLAVKLKTVATLTYHS